LNNSSIKVVNLYSRLNVGGPSWEVVNLTSGLIQRGHDCELWVGETSKDEGNMGWYAKARNIPLTQIRFLGAPLSLFRDSIAFVTILKKLIRKNPHVLHTHTFKGGFLGRLAGIVSTRPKMVHTYHGHLLKGYWGGFGVFVWKCIEKFLNRYTDVVITVSENVAQDIIRHGIAPAHKVRVVDLGLDLEKVDQEMHQSPTLRKRWGIPKEAFVVGCVGRLVSVKALDRAIDAVSQMNRSGMETYLILVGEGPERSFLEAYAKKRAYLNSRIFFAGWCVPAWREYSDFDVVVVCSKNEGTPVSLIESILAKIPVLATNVGGVENLLRNGEFGLVVEEDVDDLSGGLKKIRQNYPFWKKKVSAASEKIRKQFNMKSSVRTTEEIYRSMI